jgi:hypothetical protein
MARGATAGWTQSERVWDYNNITKAKARGAPWEHVRKSTIRDAADGHCQNCARKLFGPEDGEITHVVHIANGGGHTYDNCQLWCHVCANGNRGRPKQVKTFEDKIRDFIASGYEVIKVDRSTFAVMRVARVSDDNQVVWRDTPEEPAIQEYMSRGATSVPRLTSQAPIRRLPVDPPGARYDTGGLTKEPDKIRLSGRSGLIRDVTPPKRTEWMLQGEASSEEDVAGAEEVDPFDIPDEVFEDAIKGADWRTLSQQPWMQDKE